MLLGLSNTAGVLAGVLGTAATGFILQNGSWSQVGAGVGQAGPGPKGGRQAQLRLLWSRRPSTRLALTASS